MLGVRCIVDKFFHAAGGEEVYHCLTGRACTHFLDGDNAFRVIRLDLGPCLLLAALLFGSFLCRLFFLRLLLCRRSRHIFLTNN
jgi:hypothetical protein